VEHPLREIVLKRIGKGHKVILPQAGIYNRMQPDRER
jgi:hypothetical protein